LGFEVTPKRLASSLPSISVKAASRIAPTSPPGIAERVRSLARSNLRQKAAPAVNWIL
jgi:hypothetical protein